MRRLFFAVTLVTMLASGCGVPQTASGNPSSAAARSTSGTTQPPPITMTPNSAAAADLGGLHIESAGMQCEEWLVLKGNDYSFDAGTTQQIVSYVKAVGTFDRGTRIASLNLDQVARTTPPPGLAIVVGSVPLDAQEYADPLDYLDPRLGGCDDSFGLTNTSHLPIQIDSFGVAYASNSRQNTYPYQLVDYCSMVSCPPCGECGSRPACLRGPYFAQMTLHAGPAGTRLNPPLRTADTYNCPLPLVVAPGADTGIVLQLNSNISSQMYQVNITLTIESGGQTQTLQLPQAFTSNVVFASQRQFSCYALGGTAFRQEGQPKPSCF